MRQLIKEKGEMIRKGNIREGISEKGSARLSRNVIKLGPRPVCVKDIKIWVVPVLDVTYLPLVEAFVVIGCAFRKIEVS